ncbi:MAG: Gfo/Idh/MocA family oxidoreductase, partial [Chloroflexi bacterium]|nr:Gfo/Idh/MocA family oxidoreductase [Chloroflexota bacterium]
MQVQLGMIGAGAVARGMYLPVIQRLAGDNVRLVAVADRDPARAEALAQLTGARSYADHQLLLVQPGLDAVIVATPIGTHAAIALDALRAGKHVLLQKPMATTLAEADALIAMAQQSGVVLQCEPGHRLHPFASQAGKDLADGCIGDLCVIVARSA